MKDLKQRQIEMKQRYAKGVKKAMVTLTPLDDAKNPPHLRQWKLKDLSRACEVASKLATNPRLIDALLTASDVFKLADEEK